MWSKCSIKWICKIFFLDYLVLFSYLWNLKFRDLCLQNNWKKIHKGFDPKEKLKEIWWNLLRIHGDQFWCLIYLKDSFWRSNRNCMTVDHGWFSRSRSLILIATLIRVIFLKNMRKNDFNFTFGTAWWITAMTSISLITYLDMHRCVMSF